MSFYIRGEHELLSFWNVLWRKRDEIINLNNPLSEELVLSQTHREISNQLEQMLGKELSDYGKSLHR